jgi:voltage-gated potassium channel
LPESEAGPLEAVGRRVLIALAVLAAVFLIVAVDRDGYRDSSDGSVSLLDAAYYTTVTLSTTGYGDITPVTSGARLVNIVLVTPLRVLFLVILVGTTLEVLTRRTRQHWRLARWRSSMRDHTVVVGYGTKGRSAVKTLRAAGTQPSDIVVVDRNGSLAGEANADGLTALVGDATRSVVLKQAEIERAARIVVAPDRDDTAVLVTLTARQLNPSAMIAAAVREAENAELLRQSGADAVITSSETAGRLLGVSTVHRPVAEVIEDLLEHGRGLDLVERAVTHDEVGKSPRDLSDLVVAVVRNGELLRFDAVAEIHMTDRIVAVPAHR